MVPGHGANTTERYVERPRRRILPASGYIGTHMSPITKSCVLSLLCLTASLAAQGEAHTLRTTAKKGASVWLLQEQKEEQTIDQGGQQFEIGKSTVHTLHVTVKDVDDKGMLVVETEVVRVHGAMQMGPMGEVEFDSAAPADADEGDDDGGFGMPSHATISKAMTVLAGKKFTARVDSRGKVGSLEGVAELIAARQGRSMMATPTTEDSLKKMVESAFGIMPEQPVAVGATWDDVDAAVGRMGTTSNKVTMKLANVDGTSFEITATGTVEKPAAKDAGGESAGEGDESDEAAMARDMMKNTKIQNGKLSGSQRISREDGFLIDATNVMTMDVEMSGPMGEISMNVKMTTTTKRTTAEAAMPKKVEPAKEAGK